MNWLGNKHFLISKLLLYLCISLFFGILIYLTYYNHPHTDDYIAGYDLQNAGTSDYFKHIYKEWGGRYTSILIAALMAGNGFLFDHYQLHTILLLTANFCSIIALFYLINTYFAFKPLSLRHLFLLSGGFIALQISCLPEIVSAYYWFSSSVTYQTGIILLQFSFSLTLIIFQSASKWKRILAVIFLLLIIILINGSNETIALIQGITLTGSCLILRKNRNSSWYLTTIIAITYLASLIILYRAPGNTIRLSSMQRAHIPNAILISGGRTIYTFWFLFKNPMFWIACIIMLPISFHASLRQFQWIEWIYKRKIMLLLLIPGSVFLIYFPIMYFSNGSFPERATNTMVQYALMILLLYLFLICSKVDPNSIKNVFIEKGFYSLTIAALAISCICNQNFGNMIQSVIAAPIYHTILSSREQTLLKCKTEKSPICYLPSYEHIKDSLMQSTFSHKREQVKAIMRDKPIILFMHDDLSNGYNRSVLQRYFMIDSIVVQ